MSKISNEVVLPVQWEVVSDEPRPLNLQWGEIAEEFGRVMRGLRAPAAEIVPTAKLSAPKAG